MRRTVLGCWFIGILASFAFLGRSSEIAQARLWCLSLHFQQGTDSFGDTLDLSTIPGTPNGELAPYTGIRYASGFALDSSGFPITGTLYLNLPQDVDDNGNGWPDFFEVTQGVSALTAGSYATPLGSGTITASWNRQAGSKAGTCQLELVDSVFGSLGQYRHTFELIEYTGPLVYNPGTNLVQASVVLTRPGDPTNQLFAALQFTKAPGNRFNQFTLQSCTWTNSLAQYLSSPNELFVRDQTSWPTNYYGYLDFADGDPSTAAPDYLSWLLSFDDLNDANQNGIPDFSDDPLPRPPTLAVEATRTNLQLTIRGEVPKTYLVLQAPALNATTWQIVQTCLLTNERQVISVPLPAAHSAFWRLELQ